MKGVDGESYSWFGIGPVLISLPFYVVGKLMSVPPANLLTIINQLVGAATAVMVFYFCTVLGYSRKSSLLTSVFYGFGTMAWYYAKDPGDHALETLFSFLAIFYMFQQRNNIKKSSVILAAVFFGLSFLTKPVSILLIPALLLLILFPSSGQAFSKESIKQEVVNIAIFLVTLLPFMVLFLWYNHARFGSVFETGYGLMATRMHIEYFSVDFIITGLTGFLLSPGKGFFYYSPIAILYFFSVKAFYRKEPLLAFCFSLIIISYLIFYSGYKYWHGDWAWGPRYLFATMPFIIIPIGSLIDSRRWSSRLFKKFAYYIFFSSLVIQLASISVNCSKYFMDLLFEQNVKFSIAHGKDVQLINEPPADIYYNWQKSPIIAQFKFIGEIADNISDYKYLPNSTVATNNSSLHSDPLLNIYDYWWLFKYYTESNSSGFIVVVLLLLLATYSCCRIYLILNMVSEH